MEGKTIIEALAEENRALEKEVNHFREATIQFYDEMVEAVKHNNNIDFKEGIAFACSRLTALLLDKED